MELQGRFHFHRLILSVPSVSTAKQRHKTITPADSGGSNNELHLKSRKQLAIEESIARVRASHMPKGNQHKNQNQNQPCRRISEVLKSCFVLEIKALYVPVSATPKLFLYPALLARVFANFSRTSLTKLARGWIESSGRISVQQLARYPTDRPGLAQNRTTIARL